MSTDDGGRLPYPVPRTDPSEFPDSYTLLRRDDPVCPVSFVTGDEAFVVTRFHDVRTVLADRRFSRAEMCTEGAARYQSVRPNPDSILGMDPPRHTRLRQFANRAFSDRRVELVRPRIERVADDLLAGMATASGPVDLVDSYSRPLPLIIICELLGLPPQDLDTFTAWTEVVMNLTSTVEDMIGTYIEMRTYFAEVVAYKRNNPNDDVLSALTTISDKDGTLSDAEIVGLGTFLMVAGHDTSVTVLTEAALTIIRSPDQLALLQADPTLWPGAVEELLRLNNPGGSIFPRIALTDVELSGTVIPAGSAVVAHIGSGCRDESVHDDPDRFDVRRDVGSQIFFGHGPHFCLGAPLGRAEMEIGLRRLFGRFPALGLACPPQDLRWRDHAALGGYERFPVELNQRAGTQAVR